MTYTLHYAPDNASLIVRLVLEELGVPYETRLVDRAAQAQESTAYRTVNPAGLIPALETPHGTMFETAAILLWLADTHGQMAPPPDAPERTDFLSHLVFVSNTVHAQLRMLFYPSKYVGEDRRAQSDLRRTITRRNATHMTLPGGFDLLDTREAARGDAVVTAPSVLDYYIAAILRWCQLYPAGGTGWFDLQEYPALWTMAEDLEDRDAARKVQEAEGLGPTPFTHPSPATPPEGSAT